MPIGFFGGGMIGVLVAKVVGAVQDCPPPKDFPACNTWEYLYVGALIGVVGLPSVALFLFRKGRKSNPDA